MLSVAMAALKNGLQVTLLFSNKTKDDLICKSIIDEIKANNPLNFQVYFTLTRHQPDQHGDWDGLQGRIDWKMI
jgi:NAD(P)H-flavin reductase